MITPSEFVTRWRIHDDPELIAEKCGTQNKVSRETLKGINITVESADFLAEAGLPDSAAPFLSFNPDPLSRLPEVYPVSDVFRRYRIIGFDGSGDPICIDEQNPSWVVSLRHDDGFKLLFINSSVPQLAECLLTYRAFWGKLCATGADDAFIDERHLPKDTKEWIYAELARIDKLGLKESTFWASEVWTKD